MADWSVCTNIASGMLCAALGIFALRIRSRRPAVMAFGVITFGASQPVIVRQR